MKRNFLAALFLFAILVSSHAWGAMSDSDFLALCKSGTPEKIEAALKGGAFANARGENGITPLMIAAHDNFNAEVIKILVKYGADVKATDDYGRTALIFAAENSEPGVTQSLLDSGADVNAKMTEKYEVRTGNTIYAIYWSGSTALLIAAARNSNPDVVHVLLNAGADVNAKNSVGGFPLSAAKGAEVTLDLINFGADLEARTNLGGNALFYSRPEKIKVLIDAGIDVTVKDYRGQNALFSVTDNFNSFKMLLDAGLDINEKNERGATVLVNYFDTNIPRKYFLETMLAAGANINAADNDGNTPLIFAVREQGKHQEDGNYEGRYFDPEIITFLIDKGADPNRRNIDGKRAVDYALEKRSFAGTEALKRLVEVSRKTSNFEEDLPEKFIKGSKVNVRFAPNTKAKILSQLNEDDKVNLLGEREMAGKKWYRVKTSDGVEGWVFGDYVK